MPDDKVKPFSVYESFLDDATVFVNALWNGCRSKIAAEPLGKDGVTELKNALTTFFNTRTMVVKERAVPMPWTCDVCARTISDEVPTRMGHACVCANCMTSGKRPMTGA